MNKAIVNLLDGVELITGITGVDGTVDDASTSGKLYLTSKDFIKVKPNTDIIFTYCRNSSGIRCYDANKNFVKSDGSATEQEPYTYTVPNNIEYIKVNIFKSKYSESFTIMGEVDGEGGIEVPVNTLSLDITASTLSVGSELKLNATISPSNATNKNINWSSSDNGKATVVNGLVTAKAMGEVTITATSVDGNKTDTCLITINNTSSSVAGVTLDKSNISINIGDSIKLNATILPSNATNKNVAWTSSNINIATVNTTGMVNAKTQGNCVITCTTQDGNKTATCNIVVNIQAGEGSYENKYNLPWLLNRRMNNMNSYKFLNKKYYSLGDSIVYNDKLYRGYQTHVKEQYGTINSNFGSGGQTVVSMLSQYLSKDYSDVALVTIGFGVNDARTGIPLGTLGNYQDTEFDGSTFIGAYRKLLTKIYTDNPECRVILLTPLQRGFVSNFGCDSTNSQGKKLIDYVDAIVEIGRLYSTIVCDMYRKSGLNQQNLAHYTTDLVHPNDKGYERMAMILCHEIDNF